ncbi:DUF6461 domain-containing protein [Spongiactinospora rosea]|uniref:DUF6461 domain-containing protein n=1 Tax=Spongiactinospora rosea TaxID=2248750 RepID=UPI0011C04E53|nr:DUF6461 domain-containing protein [Spongiactinospora rosea]
MPEQRGLRSQALVTQLSESVPEICLTWCHASSAVEIGRLLGADLSTAARRTVVEADNESSERVSQTGESNVLVIGEILPWHLVAEPGGALAARRIGQLAAGSEAISLVIGDTLMHYSLLYARDGHLLCRLRWLDEPSGDTAFLKPYIDDLDFTHETTSDDWKANALELVHRITGVSLTKVWLERPHIRYLVTADSI